MVFLHYSLTHYFICRHNSQLKLLFTDTDSFCMQIETPDINDTIRDMEEHYDLSNFPVDHPMYSSKNKKIPGKMKIETGSETIHEFVGLKPKMYSLLYGKDVKEMKKVSSKMVFIN